MAKYSGSGWHKQSIRHSNARKYGKAGGKYALEVNRAFVMEFPNKKMLIRTEKRLKREGREYKRLKKDFGYAQKGFETFPINKEYSIEAHWEKTSRGFRHIVRIMKNGQEFDKATANYLNRTWERFDYESAISKLLGQNPELMNEKQRKDYLDALSKKDLERVNKEFGMIGAIAQMGEILTKDKKESNDWKERMIKAGLGSGIQMPEDWNTLSEDEKEKRLNKVIEYMKPKKTETKKDYGKSKDERKEFLKWIEKQQGKDYIEEEQLDKATFDELKQFESDHYRNFIENKDAGKKNYGKNKDTIEKFFNLFGDKKVNIYDENDWYAGTKYLNKESIKSYKKAGYTIESGNKPIRRIPPEPRYVWAWRL